MKRFIRAFRRSSDPYPSDSNPPTFTYNPSPPINQLSTQFTPISIEPNSLPHFHTIPQPPSKSRKKRHICLPTFMVNMPFSGRRNQHQLQKNVIQQTQSLLPQTNTKEITNQSQTTVLPPSNKLSNQQSLVTTAPVFYDVDDTSPTRPQSNFDPNITNLSTLETSTHSSSNPLTIDPSRQNSIPSHTIVSDVSAADPIDFNLKYPERNESLEVIVEDDHDIIKSKVISSHPNRKRSNDSFQSNEKSKKHLSTKHRTRRHRTTSSIASSTRSKSSTGKKWLKNDSESNTNPTYDNDNDTINSTENSEIRNRSLRSGSKSARTRRVKTTLTKPTTPDNELIPSHMNRYSQSFGVIEHSPYSTTKLIGYEDQETSSESTIYHAYTDALHKEARGNAGGLRTIVELLRDNDGNPIIIEKAALVVGILSENDAATRDVFGQYSAVQTLIQCLSVRMPAKYDRSKLVQSVIFAISCLLRDSPRNCRLFEMFDGPHKLGKSAASERYEKYPEIPKYALKSLSELKHHPSNTIDPFSPSQIASSISSTSRTIRYVLRAMNLHEHRVDIQEHGLDALRTLLARVGKGMLKPSVIEESAQTTAIAFKTHKESPEIQWQCLSLFCDLDDLREDLFTLSLDVESFFGALRSLASSAKQYQRTSPIVESFLKLVRRAVDVAVSNGWRSHEFKSAAVEANGVETVLETLNTYSYDAIVVDKICTILRMLLQCDEGRYQLNTVESARSILGAVETFNANAGSIQPV